MDDKLEAIEARAGASSADRDAWLAERLTGVTATEVRDLKVKGAAYRRDLLAIKTGQKTDTFTGNRYTRWGQEREPFLMAHAAREWGIMPESRVFHAAGNPRHLASPDGVGINFDGELMLAECKTSTKHIAPGTDAYDDAGYYWQMQWQMYVTGAAWCLYVIEQHSDFAPHEILDYRVERDEDAITELVTLATGFLVELDAHRENQPDPVVNARVLELVEQRDQAKAFAAALDEELRDVLDEHGIEALDVGGWSVTYSMPKPRTTFDSKAFKEDHADLYEQYVRTSDPGGKTLRAVKRKEKDA